MRDTSLDDFIGEDGAEGADGSDGGAGDDRASDGGAGDVDEPADGAGAVQPAISTSEWTPDGASCAECEVVVDRRWRDDGELVCADCKDW